MADYVMLDDADGSLWVLKRSPAGTFFKLCQVNGLKYAEMIVDALNLQMREAVVKIVAPTVPTMDLSTDDVRG